jgi:hypothetical protein
MGKVYEYLFGWHHVLLPEWKGDRPKVYQRIGTRLAYKQELNAKEWLIG